MRRLLPIAALLAGCGHTIAVHPYAHPPVETLSTFASADLGAPADAVRVGRIEVRRGPIDEQAVCERALLDGAEELEAPYLDDVVWRRHVMAEPPYPQLPVFIIGECTGVAYARPTDPAPAD